MQARVGMGQVKPGKRGELVKRLEATVYSVYREQPGFNGAVLLTNPDTGKVISLTMWDTEEHLTAGEASTERERAALSELFSAQRLRETYEVSLQAPAPQ